jgi:hypothetical protein
MLSSFAPHNQRISVVECLVRQIVPVVGLIVPGYLVWSE